MKKNTKLVNKLTKAGFAQNKSAQITMFIVLGFIIIAIFWFTYQFISSTTQQRMQEQAERAVKDIITLPALEFTIMDCLKEALEEGLVLLGQQGGFIFKEQPGSIITTEIPRTSSNISYLITNITTYPRESYPCLASMPEPDFCRFRLNDTNIRFSDYKTRLLYKPAYLSIQEQLEQFIANRTRRCTNLQKLVSDFFPQYKLTEKGINANVRFSADTVSASLEWPIEISIAGQTPALQAINFGLKDPIKVRFRSIHDILYDITYEDSSNLTYDIITNTKLPENMILTKEKTREGDIFLLTDNSSSISGQTNYTFRFARQNRAPVLGYISRHPHPQTGIDDDLYDWLAIEGEIINITAEALDPDEESPTYALAGDSWNYPLWQSNAQGFSYQTTTADIGWHNITVIARDSSSQDSQIVRILVDKQLSANAMVRNPYSDIPQNYISLEDPLILNASLAVETLDPYATYTFEWIEPVFEKGIRIQTNNPCVQIPRKNCSETQNITNMAEHLNSTTKGLHLNITLTYPGKFSQTNKTYLPIEIKQCLPHRSNIPPWPYTPDNQDPFQANHSCCINYNIAGTDTICHHIETFFCPKDKPTLLYKNVTPRHCDGTRGNICNGKIDYSSTRTEFTGLCGNATFGCESVPQEIVDINEDGKLDEAEHCGCRKEDVENNRKCIKDNKSGICVKSGIWPFTSYYCKPT